MTDKSNSGNTRLKWRTVIGLLALAFVTLAFVMFVTAVMVGYRNGKNTRTSEQRSAFSYIKMLEKAIVRYEQDVGQLPTTEQGFVALQSLPSDLPNQATWAGPYLRTGVSSFDDPWRNPYQYISPGKHGHSFTIWSYGPDGIDNTGDEIGSWMNRFP